MATKYVSKGSFAAIGKVGQSSIDTYEWILPLWNETGGKYIRRQRYGWSSIYNVNRARQNI